MLLFEICLLRRNSNMFNHFDLWITWKMFFWNSELMRCWVEDFIGAESHWHLSQAVSSTWLHSNHVSALQAAVCAHRRFMINCLSFTQRLDGLEQMKLFPLCSLTAYTKRGTGFVACLVNIDAFGQSWDWVKRYCTRTSCTAAWSGCTRCAFHVIYVKISNVSWNPSWCRTGWDFIIFSVSAIFLVQGSKISRVCERYIKKERKETCAIKYGPHQHTQT